MLNPFWANIPYLPLGKRQETSALQMFAGCMKRKHGSEMS